ncbi:MAG TPA: DUF427 domain-containing protein [Chloroflexota bacterium]|nr:DUF427 domain-containing protein [Chloroflexota bacterium]
MLPRPPRSEPAPGHESVWDYPRPPRVEDTRKRLQVIFQGVTIADTRRGKRVIETSGAPVYYFPPEDVQFDCLAQTERATHCEWKGRAVYYTVQMGERNAPNAAWSYPDPAAGYEAIAVYLGFYPSLMDRCLVDGEPARPQPGGFYGGWVTDDIVGPFKGAPGSEHW